MIVYIVVILFLFISWRKSCSFVDNDAKSSFEKRQMLIYVGIVAFLAAVKYIKPATDVEGYKGDYNMIFNMSFVDAYYRNPDCPAYYILSKIFSLTHLPYHFWFAFVEAMYFGSIALFIDKFSRDKLFSLLLSFTISVFYFTLCGSKQTLSMAFTLFSLLAVIDKKTVLGILLFILAYYCHHSSLIFLIVYAIYYITDRHWFWPVTIILGGLVVFASGYFIQTTLSLLSSEHYSSVYSVNTKTSTYTVLLYYIIIFLFAFLHKKEYSLELKSQSRFIISTSFFCIVAQSLVNVNADFFRLAYYFIPFIIVMPANTLDYYRDDKYKFILASITIFFMLYTARNGGYVFMWQH